MVDFVDYSTREMSGIINKEADQRWRRWKIHYNVDKLEDPCLDSFEILEQFHKTKKSFKELRFSSQ